MPGKTQWQWKKGIHITPGRAAALACVCAGGYGCYVLYRNILSVGERLTVGTSRVFQLERDQFPYIYLPPHISGRVTSGGGRYPRIHIIRPDEHFKGIWFPWLQKYSHDPWTLLRLARSDDHQVRLVGVQALAQHHGWHDAEYLQLAQALDRRTMIALARSDNADLRFFLKPPRLPENEETIEDSFRTLLAALPTTGIDACTQYFTSNALQKGTEGMADERGGLWCYGDSGLSYAQSLTSIPPEKMEMYCIEALLKHSLVESHCLDIVQRGGLQLLQRLRSAHPDSPNLLQHVARIVRNLALHETLHQLIVDSGWVGILAEWMRSDDVGLASTAASALGNLDRDFGLEKYQDQVYLCHPAYRSSDPVYADVVMIHGLLGGAFRTWRQKDREVAVDNEGEVEYGPQEKYSFLWPKTWLAEDCPEIRILLVDYDTNLSDWSPKCPYEREKRSLSARSLDMLDELCAAGLGNRPIVFIAHSMGGLLVKKMLVDAENDPKYRKVFRQTRGVLLYSTPHRGTQLAAYSTQARYILNPSVEVKELCRNSPMLLDLHENFKRIVYTRGLPTLCFGEMEKTKLMNMKLLVVPPESSDPGFGEYHQMDLDHLDICKPSHRQSDLYQMTREFVQDCVPKSKVDYILKTSRHDGIIRSYLS